MAEFLRNGLRLDPKLLQQLKNIELKSRFYVHGKYHSRHRTRQFGSSIEFVEHRDYRKGDEIRTIDWRLFGRTSRLFVKRFEMEANMQVHILLDTSDSMRVPTEDGLPTKLEMGSTIAGAIASMVVGQQDSVGLFCLGDKIEERIPAKQGQAHLSMLYHRLAKPKGDGGGRFGRLVAEATQRIGRRGMAVIITDAIDDLDSLFDAIKGLCVREYDVMLYQLLDRDEVEFPFERLTEFRNPDTGGKVVCDPVELRTLYLSRLRNHLDRIDDFCKKWRIDMVRLINTDDLNSKLVAQLTQRTMVKGV